MLACYMKSRCSNRWQSLKVGCTVPIQPGDICSLLPDKSWFKITSTDCSAMDEDNDVHGKRKAAIPSDEEPPDKKSRPASSVETLYSQTRTVLDDWDNEGPAPEVPNISAPNSTNDVSNDDSALKDTHSPKLIPSEPNGNPSVVSIPPADVNEPANAIAIVPAEPVQSTIQENNVTECNDSSVGVDNSARNRDEASKKIKWDCGRHFSDQTDQRTDETSDEIVGEASASTAENSAASGEASNNASPPRNKCTYGSQCYRRNPDHRTNFSHPGDADYDVPDTRPECPYGVHCYRKNPQHKRDFKHTENRRSRAQTPVRVFDVEDYSDVERSSAEESVDESDAWYNTSDEETYESEDA